MELLVCAFAAVFLGGIVAMLLKPAARSAAKPRVDDRVHGAASAASLGVPGYDDGYCRKDDDCASSDIGGDGGGGGDGE